jgi:hypothetical protein
MCKTMITGEWKEHFASLTIVEELKFLQSQAEQAEKGGSLQLCRLYDLRFAGEFALEEKRKVASVVKATRVPSALLTQRGRQPQRNDKDAEGDNSKQVQCIAYRKEPPLRRYGRHLDESKEKNRNALQRAILATHTLFSVLSKGHVLSSQIPNTRLVNHYDQRVPLGCTADKDFPVHMRRCFCVNAKIRLTWKFKSEME